MNSVDRQTTASSVAVIFFLLLIYGIVGELDCASEQGGDDLAKRRSRAVQVNVRIFIGFR